MAVSSKSPILQTNKYVPCETRWLFYIEGSLTICFALLGFLVLPDFPANTRWLSPLERRLAIKRLEEDARSIKVAETGNAKPDQSQLVALRDGKVWWLALTMFVITLSNSYAAFFPTLSKTMGLNDTTTLLLCAPPWILSAICSFPVSR